MTEQERFYSDYPTIDSVIKGLEILILEFKATFLLHPKRRDIATMDRIAILTKAIEFLKAQDVTPEELERLKKCRHDCKIECLLKEYDRVKNERDALLKAQEPRVLPLEEIQSFDGAVLVEYIGTFGKPMFEWLLYQIQHNQYVMFSNRNRSNIVFDTNDYGNGWRCWTSRPSKEEMEAIPWN